MSHSGLAPQCGPVEAVLEMVHGSGATPDTDLTRAHVADEVGFRVLLKGEPVPGTQVSIYSAGNGDIKSRRQLARTAVDGRGHVALKGNGPYLLTTTLMVRRQGETGPEAVDWESYWVSLTFALSP